MNIETIDPLFIADKLEAARNFQLPQFQEEIEKEPRIIEAIWFLQWVSMPENYAGGLAKFASDLIDKYADKILPEGVSLGSAVGSPEVIEAAENTPAHHKFFPASYALAEKLRLNELVSDQGNSSASDTKYCQSLRAKEEKTISAAMLQAHCIDAARAELAGFLCDFCINPDTTLSGAHVSKRIHRMFGKRIQSIPRNWYFPRLLECLFDYMDGRAADVAGTFAETSITREIFDWLNLARETRKGVMFLGHSRFGKSHAIRAYAKMYPGKVRLVECPDRGCESVFLREICRPLGIRFQRRIPPVFEQREAIDKVIRHARFLVIFDEAQMLYPQGGNRRTAPPRLNYVRRQFMDNEIPTAFLCTLQNWRHVEKSYLKFSAYSNEQFEGRLITNIIRLPDTLPEAEMIEVARVHMPWLDSEDLRYAVTGVRAFKGDHLSCIESIALTARHYASQDGRTSPVQSDLTKALVSVLGCPTGTQSSTVEQPAKPRETKPAGTRKTNAAAIPWEHLQTPFAGARRNVSPLAPVETGALADLAAAD